MATNYSSSIPSDGSIRSSWSSASSSTSHTDVSASPPSYIQDSSSEFLAALLSGPLLGVTVGADAQAHTWSVHLRLFAHHSAVIANQFRHALQDGDEESEPGPVVVSSLSRAEPDEFEPSSACTSPATDVFTTPKAEHRRSTRAHLYLGDTTPSAFAQLLKFIYQGSIDSLSSLSLLPGAEGHITSSHADALWAHAMVAQDLYLLGCHLQIAPVQDLAISSFRQACHTSALVPGAEEMLPIYEKTPPESPMRRLCAQIAARQIFDPDLTHAGARETAEGYRQILARHPDFAIDVMAAIRRGTGGKLLKDPTRGDGCSEWHVHDDTQKCPATKSAISKKKVTFNS